MQKRAQSHFLYFLYAFVQRYRIIERTFCQQVQNACMNGISKVYFQAGACLSARHATQLNFSYRREAMYVSYISITT